jgi:hypothetical protein
VTNEEGLVPLVDPSDIVLELRKNSHFLFRLGDDRGVVSPDIDTLSGRCSSSLSCYLPGIFSSVNSVWPTSSTVQVLHWPIVEPIRHSGINKHTDLNFMSTLYYIVHSLTVACMLLSTVSALLENLSALDSQIVSPAPGPTCARESQPPDPRSFP